MTERRAPSAVDVTAGLSVVLGVIVVPRWTIAACVLATAMVFAGLRRCASVVLMLLVLAAVVGVNVDAADHTASFVRGGR